MQLGVFQGMERSMADSFPCPRCGDRIPAEAGAVVTSDDEGRTIRRALCPSCKGPLIRPADAESPWQLED